MKIINAIPMAGYRLELKYDSGESGIVDLSSMAGTGVFEAWLQPGVFEQVKLTEAGALEWPGEIDLCPDAMYLRMTGKLADEIFPALHGRLSHA